MKLNDQQKIIELAKMDGKLDSAKWRESGHKNEHGVMMWSQTGCFDLFHPGFVLKDVPPYLISYDAIIPCIQKLPPAERIQWGYRLYACMKRDGINTNTDSYTVNTAIVATPLQMSDALLLAKGFEI